MKVNLAGMKSFAVSKKEGESGAKYKVLGTKC